MGKPLEIIASFVSGASPVEQFEQSLYADTDLTALLEAEPAPKYAQTSNSLYHYLICLDYRRSGDRLNAQDALEQLLGKQGVECKSTSAYQDRCDMLLAAQPAWLDLRDSYLDRLLASAPSLTGKALERWLATRIREEFRYAKKPPRWLQAADWPIGANGPLVFLGQFAVDEYCHDQAAIYVFLDPSSKEVVSVLQTA